MSSPTNPVPPHYKIGPARRSRLHRPPRVRLSPYDHVLHAIELITPEHIHDADNPLPAHYLHAALAIATMDSDWAPYPELALMKARLASLRPSHILNRIINTAHERIITDSNFRSVLNYDDNVLIDGIIRRFTLSFERYHIISTCPWPMCITAALALSVASLFPPCLWFSPGTGTITRSGATIKPGKEGFTISLPWDHALIRTNHETCIAIIEGYQSEKSSFLALRDELSNLHNRASAFTPVNNNQQAEFVTDYGLIHYAINLIEHSRNIKAALISDPACAIVAATAILAIEESPPDLLSAP